jgi:D-sedoheptulose 7-phosphate isomerase
MQDKIRASIAESIAVSQSALDKNLAAVEKVARAIITSLRNGGKVLLCGNGGSAADSQHIAAELIGRFQKDRKSLPAIALTTDTSILTSLANDYGYDIVFSRQVEGLGRKGDVLIGLSTSGASPNVIKAVEQAKKMGLVTIAMAGKDGGTLAKIADIAIVVPSNKTARVQEAHIALAHAICEVVEEELAK